MGQLIEMSNTITMSTREIAEMLGKNHSDIKRSAERLSEQGIFTQPLAESDFTNGRLAAPTMSTISTSATP